MLLPSSADFFQNNFSQKKFFRNTIRVPNSLDPDQDLYCVGPDLGPNCLQRLSGDDKSSCCSICCLYYKLLLQQIVAI